MAEAGRQEFCPTCQQPATRKFYPVPDTWSCEGSHRNTYGHGNPGSDTGDKAARLNRAWSKAWGEPPPPPATDVPRNSADKPYADVTVKYDTNPKEEARKEREQRKKEAEAHG